MIIEINDDLRVRFDSTCWTIEFKQNILQGKEKGGVRWPSLGYYGCLDQALNAVINKHLKFLTEKEKLSLSEVFELIQQTGEKITKLVKKQSESNS